MAVKTGVGVVGDIDATRPDSRRWWMLAFVGLSQLMIVLDTTVVNIALPAAQAELSLSTANRQWVVTAYTLAFGSLLLLSGRLGDRFGQRRLLVVGLVGFAIASLAAGAAPDFVVLAAARAAQGMFAALLAPAGLALVTKTFVDVRERARAFGVFGAISVAGATVGLLLGGLLTEYLSWRWTMYINVAFAVPAVLGVIWTVRSTANLARSRIDFPGAIAVTLGLFALVLGISQAETEGWANPWTVGLLVAAALLLIKFVLIQRRSPSPLLPLRVVLDRDRGGAYLALFLSAAGMFAAFLMLTFYLQQTLRYSAIETGLAFLPLPVVMIIVAAVIGPLLARRVSGKLLIPAGLALGAAGLVLLAQVTGEGGYFDVLPGMVLFAAGMGLINSVGMNLGTHGLRSEDSGVGSAMVNAVFQVGGSIGVAILNAIAAAASASSTEADPAIAGYTAAFASAAAIFAITAILTALVLRPGVRETNSNQSPAHAA